MDFTYTAAPDDIDGVIDQLNCSTPGFNEKVAPSPESADTGKNSQDYTKLGQDFYLALACMDAAQRFKQVKNTGNGLTSVQIPASQLATQLRTISADKLA